MQKRTCAVALIGVLLPVFASLSLLAPRTLAGDPPLLLASSVNDWLTGAQGENSWFFGYYDKTLDADGTYDPLTDFNNSDPDWTLSGGSWKLGAADPPWDSIGQTDWHPGGDNNGEVHWVIKRWVSEADGDMHCRVQFAKQNDSCGGGTTLRVLHNGVEKFFRTVEYNDTTGIDTFINLPGVRAGDLIEFALDPLGIDGLPNDGCDGSRLMAWIYLGPRTVDYLANSLEDWSTGAQGENGWLYGYYNKTMDTDGTYDPDTDFNNSDPEWTLSAGSWKLGAADPPWDSIGQTDWHPSGDNNGEIHWVIKRWVSEADGDMHCRVQFAKKNNGCGSGTTLRVLHNGDEKFSCTINYNDSTGIDTFINLPGVLVDDLIEFALDPLGADGLLNDGCDGSLLTACIYPGPWNGDCPANSFADWGTGAQGAKGWYYGYYNESLNGADGYNPDTDFDISDPEWTLSGGVWKLGPEDPPWDSIGRTDWHPNGSDTRETHWVIKRWVSNLDGDLQCRIQFAKANVGAGNGTTLHVLHNGIEKYSTTLAYNDDTGVDIAIDLPGVQSGDWIEFALDPRGTDGISDDPADGSWLAARICTEFTPVNSCPSAQSLTVAVGQGRSVILQLRASDPDGTPLTYSISQPPYLGTVTWLHPPTGTVQYTPRPDYCGPDSFTYTASDGRCVATPARVSINVLCCADENDLPPTIVCLEIAPRCNDGGQCSAVVLYEVTVTDDCDPSPTTYCNPPSGSAFPLGTTIVRCVAVDATGNAAACSFPVTVNNCSCNRCPFTQGYWKNHPDAWPAHSLVLGSKTYGQTELIAILKSSSTSDISLVLARQLIATLLNVAYGSDPSPIQATVADAQALLSQFAGKLPYKVKASSANGKRMARLAGRLDSYNQGLLTPQCWP